MQILKVKQGLPLMYNIEYWTLLLEKDSKHNIDDKGNKIYKNQNGRHHE